MNSHHMMANPYFHALGRHFLPNPGPSENFRDRAGASIQTNTVSVQNYNVLLSGGSAQVNFKD